MNEDTVTERITPREVTEDTEIPDPVTQAVKELFGLSYLFPYQRLVVANILEAAEAAGAPVHWPEGLQENWAHFGGKPDPDNDAKDGKDNSGSDDIPAVDDTDRAAMGRQIVILPTGAGKSLCFQLPAMLFEGPTLVIYPILSLMADQERRLQERSFAPVILRGGQSREEREAIWNKVKNRESRFIIANPEVLLTPKVMDMLGTLGIVHVVVDEAHCVSEWGESFRPSYLRIAEIIRACRGGGAAAGNNNAADNNPGLPLVTAFTATASTPVLNNIQKYIFGGTDAHRIIGNPDRSNISYSARGCILRDLAVRDLLVRHQRPAIVFCSSRNGTEKLARYLRNELAADFSWAREIRFYHAGLSREEKTDVEQWFFKNPEAVLLATCAYGMGVDKADIRTVIHRDCPPSVEAYLQESGRAGRDGQPSRAILLWGPDDTLALKRANKDADKARLEALFRYGRDTAGCRRETLLTLLNYQGSGDKPESDCCDVCNGNAETGLREEESVLSFFRKNRRAYTQEEAIPILSSTESIRWSEEDVKKTIRRLISTGQLKKIGYFPWKNKITRPNPQAPGRRLPQLP
ncbi:RecQ family ATP-dependent DNA helicase [Treponema primitia]|uniref:RecQ family ATP-dependent DNA helicase n=1 Tax=Treponema primitia TaxID=88058 RepID=UPI0002555538|nr:RecQ family ATP-dependent DNA helicase [Treponema primitia]